MSIKLDCIALDSKKRCKALNNEYCAIGKCNFYKTKEQNDKQIEQIRKRLPYYGEKEC